MDIRIVSIVFLLLLLGCSGSEKNDTSIPKNYLSDVGNISFDPRIDAKDFQICDSTNMSTSRRGLLFNQGKESLEEVFLERFQFLPAYESFTGFVTVRFIINCRGESDRFRAQSMDFQFKEMTAPESLKKHLIELARSLNGWTPSSTRYENLDHTKYLNFKIENGKIVNVLQ